MKCDVCHVGEPEPKLVQYTLNLDGSWIIIDHVPAMVCERCGETNFAPDVVERLQITVWNRTEPKRVIEAEVYEFA